MPGVRLLRRRGPELARADREQNLPAQGVFDLRKVECGLALVAEDLEHRRTAFFSNVHTIVVELDDVNLKGFHLKTSRVPTTRAGQCH